MKLALLLVAASVVCFFLAAYVLFLGLQVLEMNWWQGALLGITMWSLVIASPILAVFGILRGLRAFKNRRRAAQPR